MRNLIAISDKVFERLK